MKLWLTAAEIATLALPGLPATKRNVNALAESQGWSARQGMCRPRKHAGGGSNITSISSRRTRAVPTSPA